MLRKLKTQIEDMQTVKIKKPKNESLEKWLAKKGFQLHPDFHYNKKAQLDLIKRFEETLKEKTLV